MQALAATNLMTLLRNPIYPDRYFSVALAFPGLVPEGLEQLLEDRSLPTDDRFISYATSVPELYLDIQRYAVEQYTSLKEARELAEGLGFGLEVFSDDPTHNLAYELDEYDRNTRVQVMKCAIIDSPDDVALITKALAARSDLQLLRQLKLNAFNPAVLNHRLLELDNTLRAFVRGYKYDPTDSHAREVLQHIVDETPALLETVIAAVLKFEQPL